jgi:ribosome-associated protein
MARKSRKGYYIKGEFVVADSDADRQIRDELSSTSALSRTAQKQASEDLKQIGEELIAAREDLVAELPLPEHLKDAILDARRFTDFEAKRRQTQFVGKLIRGLDDDEVDAIRAALSVEHSTAAQNVRLLHQAEQWRDSLIADDERLAQWIAEFPDVNIQELRSLIRQARKDATTAAPGASERHGRAYRQILTRLNDLTPLTRQLRTAALNLKTSDGPSARPTLQR